MLKKIIIGLIALILIAVGVGAVFGSAANATEGGEDCVPQDAWTETIEHPAVTHEETRVVTPAVPGLWANFQPNDNNAPFVGPPSYPADERGSWINHGDVPPGHAGPDGVYSKGNPDKGGNWFFRKAAVAEVTEVIVVVDEEAWTEIIEHPAVECPEDPECPGNGRPFDEQPEGCPEQPEPLIEQTRTVDYECGDDFKTITITSVVTVYVWDAELQEWVLGRPVYPRPLIYTVPTDVVACDPDEPKDPKDPKEPNTPVVNIPPVTVVQVPTVIDAGL